ncbi:ATP-binding protein [Duganella vulcania]|uniref:ATP-binding protein n=1 Tax=Duganella vulcania TaxID=2692166 RepID=UPI0035A3BC6F
MRDSKSNVNTVDASQETSSEQMKLREMQLFNWGTFSGLIRIQVPEAGYLFVGPSGSGKSTILDAHASVTTPPKWVDFNVAARENERRNKDRNLLTYVRGAWAKQTTDSGEHASQFLRPDTTWSAASETYRDSAGRIVVLAQILWVRGKSTNTNEVKKLYLILERDFDLHELKFFAEHDFDVRRFKFDLPDAFVRDEFSAYQERFRRLLGIESERALRLLHKTQSAKNLGDLNDFMRDFMLDPPDAFELADKLVAQFSELNEAHRAVVDARRQIDTLKPAHEESLELDSMNLRKNELEELSSGVDKYKERQRKRLLEEATGTLRSALEAKEQEASQLKFLEEASFAELRSLQDQRAEKGGSLLEELQSQVEAAEDLRAKRTSKRDSIFEAYNGLGWAPPTTAAQYSKLRDDAKSFVMQAQQRELELGELKYGLRKQYDELTIELQRTRQEVAVLERQRSNIPARMLAVRERIARELGIREEEIPFAGELIEVRKEDASWRGAVERVLNGFAQSILVDDRLYSKFTAYLNSTHTGERIVYYRTVGQPNSQRVVGSASLVRKLTFAQGAYAEWVREELKSHFDYECSDTVHAFRAAPRAITIEGQVKHSATRHEKNDRTRVDDPSKWVLGFDNAAKLEYFRRIAFEQVEAIERLRKERERADVEVLVQRKKFESCILLSNTPWDEIDVATSLVQVESLQKRIERERQSRPDLAKLDEDIKAQADHYEQARKSSNHCAGEISQLTGLLKGIEHQHTGLREELLSVALTPHQLEGLDARYEKYLPDLTVEKLDNATTQVVRSINADEREVDGKIQNLVHAIEDRFQTFVRTWPAEAGGLDAKMASAPDFFAKLERLVTDGLPKFEERFLSLLREQSEQNLTRLATQLENERKAIRDRMALVNESLATASFGQGTHLVIETQDKLLEDVTAFKKSLRSALSNMLSLDATDAEQRFVVISNLVKRLASQETKDEVWRKLVLDVRQHVEFIAREFDKDGIEQEVYRSGAGKSGGQRQKLTATCLAAALRYQLGGQDRAMPRFCTVFLDEAFDKADAEFTTMAMNIFKTFGFQMIVATPLKSVMTLEPFIGGACFVHIKDRKTSVIIPIDYDDSTKRLKLSPGEGDGPETPAS